MNDVITKTSIVTVNDHLELLDKVMPLKIEDSEVRETLKEITRIIREEFALICYILKLKSK